MDSIQAKIFKQTYLAMNIQYTEYKVSADPAHFEIIIAFLSEMNFDSFQECDDCLLAWIDSSHITKDFNSNLENSIPVPFTFKSEVMEDKNWNQVWESQFEPVIIDQFCCIRADFHDINHKCKHEIRINPKMAFGTGHHETTEMMIRFMEVINFRDNTVFDFGTGTGILAVLARKLGANHIVAIDNDENAIENTHENIRINEVDQIDVSISDISKFTEKQYDVILANVNRNTILASLTYLYQLLEPSGSILISGILLQDKSIVLQELSNHQFDLIKIMKKGDWLCIHLTKT